MHLCGCIASAIALKVYSMPKHFTLAYTALRQNFKTLENYHSSNNKRVKVIMFKQFYSTNYLALNFCKL